MHGDVWGFQGGASGKEHTCIAEIMRLGFDPWVRKILWRRSWQPTAVFLPGESHGQRSLAGYSPRGCQESDMIEATEHTHTHTHTEFICFPEVSEFHSSHLEFHLE